MILLAASLWFAQPAPLDMPRAESYLVTESDGEMRLEDRYDETELWISRAVSGRWRDEDGRVFTLARIATAAPRFGGATKTRAEFTANEAELDSRKDLPAVKEALEKLSPIPLAEKCSRPHIPVRGMRDVQFWEGTNTSAIVAAFIEEGCDVWNGAVWTLLDGDDIEWARERFIDELLGKWDETVKKELPADALLRKERKSRKGRKAAVAPERELMRKDVAHSVANYAGWHVVDSPEFSVIDDLPQASGFVVALTNELPVMRARYRAAIPGAVNTTNALCVARIYADRDEYLLAVGEDMKWSAAYWSQERRELVAHLPLNGEAELMKTIRHEAFHQYLSYAGSMIPASPWLNEGYAQYFEDEENADWKMPAVYKPTKEEIEVFAKMLPAVMHMGYEEFYAGEDFERRLKYRLAWSIAYFLEKGAPEVRFEPWKNLKSDYMKNLVQTHDMHKATDSAFGSSEKLEKFISDWKEFWQ